MNSHVLARDLATNEPKVFAATEALANRYPCFRLGCRIYRFDRTIRLDCLYQYLDESWLEEHACECPKHINRLDGSSPNTNAMTSSHDAREEINRNADDRNGGMTHEDRGIPGGQGGQGVIERDRGDRGGGSKRRLSVAWPLANRRNRSATTIAAADAIDRSMRERAITPGNY